ncbi:universal stress protein [Corynebacterium tapiri]|uniref:Universal stress protein n=1 Tax=Corynebacterium tapiri TaxID=1448266 RepID=A0A5C4U7H7_9CORY|nr:universal stress protein [Corynebacterium tapiri]TNL99835.1 universal stress protein [Corynebacterium tapiri]
MYSYSTIVVGTDGTDTAEIAVRHAAALARAFEAKLIIACGSYGNSGSLLNSPNREVSTLPVVSEELAQEYLTSAFAVAKDEGVADIELECISATPVDALLTCVDEHDADAVVVGNQGVNSLTGRVFGNIPTETARRSTVDVVLVNTQR